MTNPKNRNKTITLATIVEIIILLVIPHFCIITPIQGGYYPPKETIAYNLKYSNKIVYRSQYDDLDNNVPYHSPSEYRCIYILGESIDADFQYSYWFIELYNDAKEFVLVGASENYLVFDTGTDTIAVEIKKSRDVYGKRFNVAVPFEHLSLWEKWKIQKVTSSKVIE